MKAWVWISGIVSPTSSCFGFYFDHIYDTRSVNLQCWSSPQCRVHTGTHLCLTADIRNTSSIFYICDILSEASISFYVWTVSLVKSANKYWSAGHHMKQTPLLPWTKTYFPKCSTFPRNLQFCSEIRSSWTVREHPFAGTMELRHKMKQYLESFQPFFMFQQLYSMFSQ